MKKIMFSDRYGLTKAVLDGNKTMTRHIIPPIEVDWNRRGIVTLPISSFKDGLLFMDTSSILPDSPEYLAPKKYQPKYNVDDVVAVAQKYSDIMPYLADSFHQPSIDYMKNKPGYNNKLFVRADLMPNKISFTGLRMERLQDISDEDCIREGIVKTAQGFYSFEGWGGKTTQWYAMSPREAFSALIDKVVCKGCWNMNPWVYVNEFERVI